MSFGVFCVRMYSPLLSVRIPELLFQPSMIGVEQAGVAETVQFVLNKYPIDIQNKLSQVSRTNTAQFAQSRFSPGSGAKMISCFCLVSSVHLFDWRVRVI